VVLQARATLGPPTATPSFVSPLGLDRPPEPPGPPNSPPRVAPPHAMTFDGATSGQEDATLA